MHTFNIGELDREIMQAPHFFNIYLAGQAHFNSLVVGRMRSNQQGAFGFRTSPNRAGQIDLELYYQF